ncbi:secretion-regulating guanine nucleotide exchange factor isoform X1 [Labeo rohita]|uniref:Secretion-regulating guanine nucleotide exchange factor isoform X1 n=1 Tax=Labeo rohita TaxID=84645 RepID=A0A498MQL1_LABRO|nr:secretion-regulating guanine nucleotide exchange factor isoform X1 [Labeo rohita]
MEGAQLSKCVLYTWGANSYGQLGQGNTEDQAEPRRADGGLQAEQIRCITGGGGHSAVITGDGRVLAFGSNAFGQLGVSPRITHSAEPLHVKTLDEPVTSVAAGLRHALASTVEGDVFFWGSNKHGQLVSESLFLPLPVALDRSPLRGERVTDVHSGWTHLVARTESGRVFTWGRANYGQLGQTNQSTEKESDVSTSFGQSISRPVEVKALFGATQIACGSEHNLAVVGGRIYSWGWNEHGMCGDGSLCDITQPQPIPRLRDTPALLIGCGSGHSIALCSLKSNEDSAS